MLRVCMQGGVCRGRPAGRQGGIVYSLQYRAVCVGLYKGRLSGRREVEEKLNKTKRLLEGAVAILTLSIVHGCRLRLAYRPVVNNGLKLLGEEATH